VYLGLAIIQWCYVIVFVYIMLYSIWVRLFVIYRIIQMYNYVPIHAHLSVLYVFR